MKAFVPLFIIACSAANDVSIADPDKADSKAFTSDLATLMDFEFDGQFYTRGPVFSGRQAVEDHMLYTIGHLNHDNGVGRLDGMSVTNIRTAKQADGTYLTQYHVVLPVSWSKGQITSYHFQLPKFGDYEGYEAFTEKYKETCVDFGAHEVSSGSMWYYYRPSNCPIDAADVLDSTAKVSVSTQNSSNKYPEYHMVWDDDVLDVIAIFGKYEDGATSDSDAGISAYNEMLRRSKQDLGATMTGASPDVTFTRSLPNGKSLRITALLVDNVRTAGPEFDARYNALSKDADLIAYNGHAGLGSNVRALVRKGEFKPNKYQMFFMNGCDTYAYVDGALIAKKKSLNPEDPNGTKYLDFITNAMPAYFQNMADADVAIIKALVDVNNPKTYDQIFKGVDSSQVVVATGEEDNVYFPGFAGGDQPTTWPGLSKSGTLAQGESARAATPVLAAGTYTFAISGTGDADLYVRVGAEPTDALWDCRPYTSSSDESCTVTLQAPAAVNVMVKGYAAATYTLTGR